MTTRVPPVSGALLSVEEMRRARLARDASYDGVFWVGVRTTGIYCRPSCPARPPKEENVTYLDSTARAREEGLRACKRCRPDSTDGSPPELVARLGKPGAARAVGRANGANRVAIVLPCHRVVQADGGLRGYGGGLWRKRWLLARERRD